MPASSAGYSTAWFDTFAEKVPASITAIEVAAIVQLAPPDDHPRLIELACGVGRALRGLAAAGYEVTGVDASVDALGRAREATGGGRFVAMDARDVGAPHWTFDVAVVLWNSIGFDARERDIDVLRGLARILRPGGRLLMDLYHPDWLETHQLDGDVDSRGVTIDRWLDDGRSRHLFTYPDGTTEDVQFNVYRPGDMDVLLQAAGFRVDAHLVWWKTDDAPSAEHPRYQVAATRV